MAGRLPDFIDPCAAAHEQLRLAGELPLAAFRRLGPEVLGGDGGVAVELAGAVDSTGLPVLTGRVAARLTVRCQRCLEPMVIELDVPVVLAAVSDDAAAERLPDAYAPLLAAPGAPPQPLAQLVEDELLLALPDYVRHPQTDCARGLAPATAARRPFAVLGQLELNRPPGGAPESS